MSSADARKRRHPNLFGEESDEEGLEDLVEAAHRREFEERQQAKRSKRGESNDAADQSPNENNVVRLYMNTPPKKIFMKPTEVNESCSVDTRQDSLQDSSLANETLETIPEISESLLDETTIVSSHIFDNLSTLSLNERIRSQGDSNLAGSAMESGNRSAGSSLTKIEVSVEASGTIIEGEVGTMIENETSELPIKKIEALETEIEAGEPTEIKIDVKSDKKTEVTTIQNQMIIVEPSDKTEINNNEKTEITSKKISLRGRTNIMYFDPLGFAEDPSERKLPDLRSKRDDPTGYVAPYPRKGEKLTEETTEIYEQRIGDGFNQIQRSLFAQQRRSLDYMKWAKPIDIPVEPYFRRLTLASERKTDTLAPQTGPKQNESEIHAEGNGAFMSQSQRFGDGDVDPSPNKRKSFRTNWIDNENKNVQKITTGQSINAKVDTEERRHSKARFKWENEDSSDDFEPSQNKKMSSRRSSQVYFGTGKDNKSSEKSGKDRLSKANYKQQLSNSSDDFDPSPSQKLSLRGKTGSARQKPASGMELFPERKTYSRKRNNSGEAKVSAPGLRLASFYERSPGKKIDIYDYPAGGDDDSEEEEVEGRGHFSGSKSRGRKSVPKASTSSQSKRPSTSGGVRTRSAVRERSEKEEQAQMEECPFCEKEFLAPKIDDHVYHCTAII